MRILGIDPGLTVAGWGIVDSEGNRLRHIANGAIKTNAKLDMATRLRQLHDGLNIVLDDFQPDEAAVEETFANTNAVSTLALGQARGVLVLGPRLRDIPVVQYLPNKVKKAVVGVGKADKLQVQMMVKTLMPGVTFNSADAADALAVAICHAHLRTTQNRLAAL